MCRLLTFALPWWRNQESIHKFCRRFFKRFDAFRQALLTASLSGDYLLCVQYQRLHNITLFENICYNFLLYWLWFFNGCGCIFEDPKFVLWLGRDIIVVNSCLVICYSMVVIQAIWHLEIINFHHKWWFRIKRIVDAFKPKIA